MGLAFLPAVLSMVGPQKNRPIEDDNGIAAVNDWKANPAFVGNEQQVRQK